VPFEFFVGPDILALFIPIIALTIPIVAILSGHQRRMAEIIHQGQVGTHQAEIAALQRQVEELRQLVGQQTFVLEDMRTRMASLPPSATSSQRIGG
jgi:hypothetical protein